MAAKARRGRRSPASETQYLHGVHCILEALRAGRRPLRRLMLVRDRRDSDDLRALAEAAVSANLLIEEVDREQIDRLAAAGDSNPQGAVLEAGPLPEYGRIGNLLEAVHVPAGRGLLVALDGVEDPHNVGAIARVAEAAGAHGLILAQRRAPPLGPALARASAGAIEWLPVARVPHLGRALAELEGRSFWSVGADPDSEVALFDVEGRWLEGSLVVVLGAEGRGLRRSIRERIDHRLKIPMRGRVHSLNVATACAVMLYEIGRRRRVEPLE